MSKFKEYRRTQIAEMREVTSGDIYDFHRSGLIRFADPTDYKNPFKVSISDVDLRLGSPKLGDMIARNPNNHNDQWLVSQEYFKNNFEEL